MPFAAVVLLMVEVYGVSDYSVTSALAILSSAGPAQVAAGATLVLVPYLLPVIGLLALWRGFRLHAAGHHPDHAILAWALAVAALLLSAWQNVLLVIAVGVVYVAVFAAVAAVMPATLGNQRAVERPARRPRPIPMVIVALLAGFFASLSDPWVAPEIVTLKATPATEQALEARDGFVRTAAGWRGVAYPLDTGQSSETFLARTTRRVIHLRSDDVLARSVCRYDLPSYKEALIHELLGHSDQSPNPPCPSVDELTG